MTQKREKQCINSKPASYYSFILFILFIFIRAISSRIDTAHQVHATCTHLLASSDNYTLLDEYKKATDGIQSIFINLPSMDPVARDDLLIDFPKEAADELQSQYYSHGNIRSGLCCYLL